MSDKTAPYVENYPVLEEWLDRQRAQHLWALAVPNAKGATRVMVSAYLVKGQLFLVTVEPDQRGWNIYTALDSIHIMESLVAEERLGLKIEVQ